MKKNQVTSYPVTEDKSIKTSKKINERRNMNPQRASAFVEDKRIGALRYLNCKAWLTLPMSVVIRQDLTSNEKIIYGFLLFKSNLIKEVYKNEYISEILGIHEKQVSLSIQGLIKKGLLRLNYSNDRKIRTISHISSFHGERLFYMPMPVVHDKKLSFSSKIIYSYLISCCYEKSSCYPGLDYIRTETGYTDDSIYKAMRQLYACGMLVRHSAKKNRKGIWIHNLNSIDQIYGNILSFTFEEFEKLKIAECDDRNNGLKNYHNLLSAFDSFTGELLEQTGVAYYLRKLGYRDIIDVVLKNEKTSMNGYSSSNFYPKNLAARLESFAEKMDKIAGVIPKKSNRVGMISQKVLDGSGNSCGSKKIVLLDQFYCNKGNTKKSLKRRKNKFALFFSQRLRSFGRSPKTPNPFSPAQGFCMPSSLKGVAMSNEEKTPSQKRREARIEEVRQRRLKNTAEALERSKTGFKPLSWGRELGDETESNVVSLNEFVESRQKEFSESDLMKQRLKIAKESSKEAEKQKREIAKVEKSNRLENESRVNYAQRTLPTKLHELFYEGARQVGHVVNKEPMPSDIAIWKHWLKRLSDDGFLEHAKDLVEYFFNNYEKMCQSDWRLKKTPNINLTLFSHKDISSLTIAMFLKGREKSSSPGDSSWRGLDDVAKHIE